VPKQTLTRKAADNPYFHRDFHIALNYAIDYLHRKFGEEAVWEYLAQFAEAWYSPLKKSISENGLIAVKDHYEKIYKIEEADYEIQLSEDELIIHLAASPAVMHIKSKGHRVSELFHETVAAVNKAICKNTPFDCELREYRQENGGYTLLFSRRTG